MIDKVPSENECFLLMEKHNMFPNIINHSKQVMKVALTLFDNLVDKKQGDINREIIMAAALLHDIYKTESIKRGVTGHAAEGGKILRKLNMITLAEIVEEHVELKSFSARGPILNKELVFYADKRVKHDRIVSTRERFDDIIDRYGGGDMKKQEIIKKNYDFLLELEKKISKNLKKPIEEIISEIK